MKITKDKTYLAKPCDTILQGNVNNIRGIMVRKLLVLPNVSGLSAIQVIMQLKAFAMKIGSLNDMIVGFVYPEIKLF